MSHYYHKLLSGMSEEEKSDYAQIMSRQLAPLGKRLKFAMESLHRNSGGLNLANEIKPALESLLIRNRGQDFAGMLKRAETTLQKPYEKLRNLFGNITPKQLEALIEISYLRIYYEQVDEHKSSFSAWVAISISQEHDLPTPLWARNITDKCAPKISGFLTDPVSDPNLKQAFGIDGNDIKRLNRYSTCRDYHNQAYRMITECQMKKSEVFEKLAESNHKDIKTFERDYYAVYSLFKENWLPPPLTD